MEYVDLVENPRRRRSRRGGRSLTAKQLAAGFGGKSHMRRKTRRRRNPALATLTGNPRRRRRRSHSSPVPRHRRRYSNPIGLKGITSMLNLRAAIGVGGGLYISKSAPGWLRKAWPGAPVSPYVDYGARVAAVLAAALILKKVRQPAIAAGVVAGGVGVILYELATDYLLPKDTTALSGYYARPALEAPPALGGYNASPQYKMTDMVLSA